MNIDKKIYIVALLSAILDETNTNTVAKHVIDLKMLNDKSCLKYNCTESTVVFIINPTVPSGIIKSLIDCDNCVATLNKDAEYCILIDFYDINISRLLSGKLTEIDNNLKKRVISSLKSVYSIFFRDAIPYLYNENTDDSDLQQLIGVYVTDKLDILKLAIISKRVAILNNIMYKELIDFNKEELDVIDNMARFSEIISIEPLKNYHVSI